MHLQSASLWVAMQLVASNWETEDDCSLLWARETYWSLVSVIENFLLEVSKVSKKWLACSLPWLCFAMQCVSSLCGHCGKKCSASCSNFNLFLITNCGICSNGLIRFAAGNSLGRSVWYVACSTWWPSMWSNYCKSSIAANMFHSRPQKWTREKWLRIKRRSEPLYSNACEFPNAWCT